jgi:hypothetical protein
MSPGLPGLGLGGLFFILTALIAPAIELARTARGQSSLGAWRSVGRQFTIAVVMIIAVDLTVRGALLAVSLAGAGEGASDRGLTVLPVVPLGITAALLAMVLGGVKALELCLRVRDRGLPRVSVPAAGSLGYRIVPGTGVLAAVWLATLLFGPQVYGRRPAPRPPQTTMAGASVRSRGRRDRRHDQRRRIRSPRRAP